MGNLVFHLCKLVVAIASIAPNACRSSWYQPKEPEHFEEFVHSQAKR